MITCGVDIGSGSTKGVLMENGTRVIAKAMLPTKGNPVAATEQVLAELARAGGIGRGDIAYICTTGFARYGYPDRNLQVSDITASARGAVFLFPDTRHVVDIGTQSSRAIGVTERGKVTRFKMNEKCAAGAGRFVERCSKYLQVPLAEMGPMSLTSSSPRVISSVCAVLAETEIINYVAEEVPIQDILMGIFLSLTQRVHTLMKFVGIVPKVTLVGGMVHNVGVAGAMRKVTGMDLNISPESHYAAALGSAILGHSRLMKLPAAGA